MTDDLSARLGLSYLAAGQLQKHVTLNETLTRLDALVQSAAVSRATNAQPGAPDDGDLYILPAAATGSLWAGHEAGEVLRYEAGGWSVVPVSPGAIFWIEDEAAFVVRDGAGWSQLGARLGAVQGLTRLGLNSTADAANPFTARLNKALWTAVNAGDGGDGDLRLTFNKEGAGDVLSLLFQSGYGGRAELGLIGGDEFSIKVSADGSTWRTALTIDETSGAASFPSGCGRVEVTVLTSSSSWPVPPWARRVEAVVVGGGGGGGSGAAGATGTSRFGGGGGGAGGACVAAWSTNDLANSLTVTIGAGGTGGAGSTGVGVAGGPGGVSLIASSGVTLLSGPGGAAGQGGSTTGGAGGAGGSGIPVSNAGGASSVTAAGGVGGTSARPDVSGGGGAGGGLDASNTARSGGTGGTGGNVNTPASGGAGGGASGSGAPGSAGAAASAPTRSWASGGGGGGSGSTANGLSGGQGAAGAGAGGGGAGVTMSGAGGAAGAGLVRLTAIG